MLKNFKGITLIALVVTIIVLLILSGVSIAMLTGENGILTKAQEAKRKTEEAEHNEQVDLDRTEDKINEYVNGVKVEQVVDKNPGVLELDQTEENTLIINSIEDLVFFAYDVRKGNTYEGNIVKLGLSLDFNSTKSYVEPLRTDYKEYGYDGELQTLLTTGEGFLPIGTTSNIDWETNSFAGTFDGNNKEIINLYINKNKMEKEEIRIGLFGSNNGIIRNLKILNGNMTLKMTGVTGDISGIAAKNYNTIQNCAYEGNINIYASGTTVGRIGIAGIAVGNEITGVIENCYHNGILNVENDSQGADTKVVGGISGANNGKISKCYSSGKILGNNMDTAGGITSLNQKTIDNCYNLKEIVVEDTTYTGGIVGNTSKDSQIHSCYNIEKVNSSKVVGAICGLGRGIIDNCYFLSINGVKGIGGIAADNNSEYIVPGKTEEEMKNDDFLNLLQNNNEEKIWKKDNDNINNGYPILNWQ